MRKFILTLLLLSLTSSLSQARHVILCGGPALRSWEDLRVDRDQHDRWWANFVRASTMRMGEIRKVYGDAPVVWIVYKPGYTKRGYEDGKPYTQWIQEQAKKRGAKLKWVSSGSGAISAINSQPKGSVKTFDFFGHSNKHCFLLDYGSEIMAASKAWIHENDLGRIRSSIFSKGAICQSYGCHTGESMSGFWKRATGITLVGANGKTDYVVLSKGLMPKVMGSWVY